MAPLQEQEVVNALYDFKMHKVRGDLSECTYPVVDAVEVGVEALVVPPAAVGDLSADVAAVGGAEALLVVVPAERVQHRPAEARHVQAVLVLLVFHTANRWTGGKLCK